MKIWVITYPDIPQAEPILFASKEDACQEQTRLVVELLETDLEDDFSEEVLELTKKVYALAMSNKFIEAIEAIEAYTNYYDENIFWDLHEMELSAPSLIETIDFSKYV